MASPLQPDDPLAWADPLAQDDPLAVVDPFPPPDDDAVAAPSASVAVPAAAPAGNAKPSAAVIVPSFIASAEAVYAPTIGARMAVQPTYYFGFDLAKIGQPTITVTRGAFVYATFPFITQKFFHPVADGSMYASFAAYLKQLLDVYSSAAGDTAVWTVTWNHATLAYTISPSLGTFTAVLNTTMRQIIGASADISVAVASFTSTRRPDSVIRPNNDSWRSDAHDYEPDGVALEEETDDGEAYGLARTASPRYFEITQMFELMAAVYDEQATASVPFTWYKAFKQVRNFERILLAQAPWTQTTISYSAADIHSNFRLRAKGASFKPGRHVAKPAVNTYWMIPLACRLIEHPP